MDDNCFTNVLSLIKPHITKKDTVMRQAISFVRGTNSEPIQGLSACAVEETSFADHKIRNL